jgi:hypothetical protein
VHCPITPARLSAPANMETWEVDLFHFKYCMRSKVLVYDEFIRETPKPTENSRRLLV